MINEKELLLRKLKDVDFVSYRMMQYLSNIDCFGLREMKMKSKLDQRLYSLFLESINEDNAKVLKAIDTLIDETIKSITKSNAWDVDRHGAVMIDNYQNWDDYEFRTCDTHRIIRDDSGYYIEEATTPYEIGINKVSNAFLNSHKKEFEDLHKLYSEKESIMHYGYYPKASSTDSELPRLISSYLGYYKEKEVRRSFV